MLRSFFRRRPPLVQAGLRLLLAGLMALLAGWITGWMAGWTQEDAAARFLVQIIVFCLVLRVTDPRLPRQLW